MECQTIMSHLDIAKLQEEKAELLQKVESLSSTCEQLRSQCDQVEIDNSSCTEETEEKEKCLRLSALDENSFRDNDEVCFVAEQSWDFACRHVTR